VFSSPLEPVVFHLLSTRSLALFLVLSTRFAGHERHVTGPLGPSQADFSRGQNSSTNALVLAMLPRLEAPKTIDSMFG
jgi:hypothetical protein